jgi:integrase
MPLKLVPPRADRSPNWRIRGTYLGVAVDRTAGTPKRVIAVKALKQIEERIEAGEYERKPGRAPATFAEAALAYIQAGRRRRYVLRLAQHFRDTPIAEIGQAEIDAAALVICPGTSPATRNCTVYTPTLAILHMAGAYPKVRRPLGAKGKVRTDYLNPADAWAVIKAADELDAEFGTLLRFLLYTGCRLGEALALTWDRIDLDRGTAYVSMTKNGDPRTLVLRQDLQDRLRPRSAPSGRLFRWHSGGWLREMMLHSRMVASGLQVPERFERGRKRHVPWHRLHWVTFHTFRHTWATWIRQYGGADLQGLVATGNWRDPRSAARYAHVVARDEWERVEKLPALGAKNVESA